MQGYHSGSATRNIKTPMIKLITGTGIALIMASVAIIAVYRVNLSEEPAVLDNTISPAQLLGAVGDNYFARVDVPYNFQFPADHGSHTQYRTESWQLSGVLNFENKRNLGVQIIVIRIALGAEQPQDHQPNWSSSEIYAGLFSMSDPDGNQLHTDQRLSRGGIGLADWQQNPMRLWVEDWMVERTDPENQTLDLKLHVAADNLKLELELHNQQPLITLNDISSGKNTGSFPFVYYVQPRLNAVGSLSDGVNTTQITGTVSVEHAWGELPLLGGPVAQDRFTLYMEDGGELFLIRTHRVDGSGTPTTTGLLIREDGALVNLPGKEIELRPVDYWTSSVTGANYPLHWTLRISSQNIDMELIANGDNEEGIIWAPFWAGSARLQNRSGLPIGDSFMQLSGYKN